MSSTALRLGEIASNSLGVFADNRTRPIHRWYPFVEGYSAEMLDLALQLATSDSPAVFDPFGGSGTSCLAAAERALDSWYCEINPYLAWVARTKVNAFRQATGGQSVLCDLAADLEGRKALPAPDAEHPLLVTEEQREFFPDGVASEVVSTLELIDRHTDGAIRDLARLAVATTLIRSSNMIRRTDLRRRREGDPLPADFRACAVKALRMIAEDLADPTAVVNGSTTHICRDVREVGEHADQGPRFDLVVTSPPYLNGTNYFRNTKLELLALQFVDSERGLSPLRGEAITAGINNVSRRRGAPARIDQVEDIAVRLDEDAYDHRIPTMVRLYFSDMRAALSGIRSVVADGAPFLLDIGDSRFAGVHVPTHDLLASIAEDCGWSHVETSHVRDRRSYDGSPLVQVILRFVAK